MQFDDAPLMEMPLKPLGSALVPAAERPMRLPWTRFPLAPPVRKIPSRRLPEITLLAPMRFALAAEMVTPAL